MRLLLYHASNAGRNFGLLLHHRLHLILHAALHQVHLSCEMTDLGFELCVELAHVPGNLGQVYLEETAGLGTFLCGGGVGGWRRLFMGLGDPPDSLFALPCLGCLCE